VNIQIKGKDRSFNFSDADRERLAGFVDALIAGGSGFPSASEADVHTKWIDRALSARPDLAPLVRRVLETSGEPQDVLDRLKSEDETAFDELGFLVAGAYLINPKVRKGFGYPGSVPEKNPAFPDEAEAYLDDGILDRVISRGPIYRPTPDLETS